MMPVRNRFLAVLPLLAALPFFAMACNPDAGGGESDGRASSLTRHESCVQSLCDQIHDDCMSYIDECFGQCAGMSYEFAYQCVSICNDHECASCTVDECAQHAYEFEVTGPRDENVFASCERARVAINHCGGDVSFFDCDRFARLERPEAAASYDCYAGLACGADGASCEPPISSWGIDFCLALNAECDVYDMGCTPEQADELTRAAAWLKDDVRAEAMKCVEEASCKDVSACLDSWFETVFP